LSDYPSIKYVVMHVYKGHLVNCLWKTGIFNAYLGNSIFGDFLGNIIARPLCNQPGYQTTTFWLGQRQLTLITLAAFTTIPKSKECIA
jgi:hypothetical protein